MDKQISRGEQLWGKILYERDHAGISLARARLYTESWKTTDGEPPAIRRGLAMKHVLENIPLYLDDQQLLCGSFSSRSMWAEWYPEYECAFLLDSADAAPALKMFSMEEKDFQEIQEIAAYWKGKAIESKWRDYIKPEDLEVLNLIGANSAFVNNWESDVGRHGGYYCVDMKKAIEKGYSGVIGEINHEIANTTINDLDSLVKVQNLRGWRYALEGAIAYGRRCARMCRDLADACADKTRKAELLEMADVCERVPENPARTFHEALQMVIFVHLFVYLETRGDGVSPGRADQYLYPCFKSDLEKGALSEERIMDLLQCFRVKFNTFRQLSNSAFMMATNGEAQFHNITIGGKTSSGECAVNELSYLFIEAAMRLRMPHPTLSLRYYAGMPDDIIDKALQCVALGGGYPAFFNDDSNIPCLVNYGISIEDANNYAVGGCVWCEVAGKTGPGYPVTIHLPKCIELAIHDGFDPFTLKRQVGPHTGKFADFKTFDEFYNAFKTQVVWASEVAARQSVLQRTIRAYQMPAAFTETLMDDCIKTGKTSTGDGPRYQLQYHNARCMIDCADSLTAVKKCVFEDKSVDQSAFAEILKNNFIDHEDVRKILLDAPSYGNDNDYADEMAHDVYRWWADMVKGMDAGFGDHYLPGAYTVGAHVNCGLHTGALPDGRCAGDPLADGSVSSRQGVDINGPTAVMNSANKIDQSDMTSTLLNLKFQESALKNDEDRAKLAALIKGYFAGSGKHVQFNVVSKKTLLAAKEAPEKYRSLLVRVAGYSAFFVELQPNLQAEIINRTENAL